MKKKLFFFLFYSFNILNISIKCQESLLKTKNVTEGVYNIIVKKKYSCVTYIGGLRTSREKYGNSRLNFRISEIKDDNNTINNNNNINSDNDNNIKYYTIRHLSSHNFLGVKTDKISSFPIVAIDRIIKNTFLSFKWTFINIQDNTFIIRNKAGCYLKEDKNNIICSQEIKRNPHFHLLKLYQEVSMTENEKLILEQEPIDVLIKYIDLSDPTLTREGIHQIKKDQDNEELRYSLRSILKNIPWVRKIFILMPNKKVRYLKDYEFINEKIVYVKDKDLLGYDSSNSHAFQYRLWKMKEFGLSDNFIYMDDDYFIGKPLNKSDFFYVENNKVVPAIINTNYEVHTKNIDLKEYENLKKKIQDNKREQTSNRFMYTVYKTYLFLIKYFNSPIIVPYFTHNAIPANLNEIKEIFDLVDNSEYKNATLDSIYRHTETLQFQTTLIVYVFNKYKRKANLLNYNYIDNAKTIYGKYNYPLFCINTGNNNDYLPISFSKTKIVMEKLFPIPTKYEIYDSKIVPNNAFEVLKSLDKDLSMIKAQKEKDDVDKEKFENERISKEYDKCINQVDMFLAQNFAYTNKNKKRKSELENCKKNCEIFEAKIRELKIGNTNYIMREKIKEELNKVIDTNKNYTQKIYEYKNENNNYLKEIERLKNKDRVLYFFIYFQLILIIILLLIIGVYYPLKKKINEKKDINENGYNKGSNFRGMIKTENENDEKLKLFDEVEMDLIK